MLRFTIKEPWFSMILHREKLEEYRQIKEYWAVRLARYFDLKTCQPLNSTPAVPAVFVNGYQKDAPSFMTNVTLSIGGGRTEWGAVPGEIYYILHTGDCYNITNTKETVP